MLCPKCDCELVIETVYEDHVGFKECEIDPERLYNIGLIDGAELEIMKSINKDRKGEL